MGVGNWLEQGGRSNQGQAGNWGKGGVPPVPGTQVRGTALSNSQWVVGG